MKRKLKMAISIDGPSITIKCSGGAVRGTPSCGTSGSAVSIKSSICFQKSHCDCPSE